MKKGRIVQVIGSLLLIFFLVNVGAGYVDSFGFTIPYLNSPLQIPAFAVHFTAADTQKAEAANNGPILAAVAASFEDPTYVDQPINASTKVLGPGSTAAFKPRDLVKALTDAYYGPKGSQPTENNLEYNTITQFAADYSPARMARVVWDNYGQNGITDSSGHTYKTYSDFYAAISSSTDYAKTVASAYNYGWKLDCSAGGCGNGQTSGTQFICACKYWGAVTIGSATEQMIRAPSGTPPSTAQLYGMWAQYGYDPTYIINGLAMGNSGTGASTFTEQVDPTFYGNNYLKVGFGTQPEYIIDGNGNAVLITNTGANTFTGPSQIQAPYGGGTAGDIWQLIEQNGGIAAIQGGSARGIVLPEQVVRTWGAKLCGCDANSDQAVQAAAAEVSSLGAAASVIIKGWIVSDNSGDCDRAAGAGGGCISVSAWTASVQNWESLSPVLESWNAQTPSALIEWGWAPYSSGIPGFTSISTPTMWDAGMDVLMYPTDTSLYSKLLSCTGACGTLVLNDQSYLEQLWATVKLNGWMSVLPNLPGYPQIPSSFAGLNVPYPTLGCLGPSCPNGAKYTNYGMNGIFMQLMRLVLNPPAWYTGLYPGAKACTGSGCISFSDLVNWVQTSVQEQQAVQKSNYSGLAGILGANAIYGTPGTPGVITDWQTQGCWTGSSCGEPGQAASKTWSDMLGLGNGWQNGQGGWSFDQVQAWSWGTKPDGSPGGYGWAPDPGCPSGNCGSYGAFAKADPLAQLLEEIASYNTQHGLPNIPDMWAFITSTAQDWLNFKSYSQCRAAGLGCGYHVTPQGVFVVDPPVPGGGGAPGTPGYESSGPGACMGAACKLGPVDTSGVQECTGSRCTVVNGVPVDNVYDTTTGRPLGCIAFLPLLCQATSYKDNSNNHVSCGAGCGGTIALLPMKIVTGADGHSYAFFSGPPPQGYNGISAFQPQPFDLTGQFMGAAPSSLSTPITLGPFTMLAIWLPYLAITFSLILLPSIVSRLLKRKFKVAGVLSGLLVVLLSALGVLVIWF